MPKRRHDSTFTIEQETFIVEQFVILKSETLVKRAFQAKFKEEKQKWRRLKPWHFLKVYQRFQKNGIASPSKDQRGIDAKSDPEKIEKISQHFVENPCDSLRIAEQKLDIPYQTISWILKNKLKMTPYKMSLGQVLTAAHKEQRLAFCQWLLEQPLDFEQIVCWSDEKWYHLTQHPNRQNVRFWSVANPHFHGNLKSQGCAKIMAFVIIVDGKVLPVIWHVDADGKSVPVNQDRYLKVLQENVFPNLGRKIKKLWWMQDGASCHTATKVMTELRRVFKNRLISRNAEIAWPAHSPDLNPLDYSFWGQSMAEVYERQPKTIAELCEIVENFASNMSEDQVRKMVSNVRKRAQKCVEVNGDHFEHLM